MGGSFHFYSSFDRTFSKQTVETLIKHTSAEATGVGVTRMVCVNIFFWPNVENLCFSWPMFVFSANRNDKNIDFTPSDT